MNESQNVTAKSEVKGQSVKLETDIMKTTVLSQEAGQVTNTQDDAGNDDESESDSDSDWEEVAGNILVVVLDNEM